MDAKLELLNEFCVGEVGVSLDQRYKWLELTISSTVAFDILYDIFHDENDRPDFTGIVRVMMTLKGGQINLIWSYR